MLLVMLLHTVYMQLVQEFRVLLLMGRKLVFPVQTAAVVCADVTMELQVEGASDPTGKRTVSLMFPGNARTVVRLMDAWQEAQVIWGTSQVDRAHTISSAAGLIAYTPTSPTNTDGAQQAISLFAAANSVGNMQPVTTCNNL